MNKSGISRFIIGPAGPTGDSDPYTNPNGKVPVTHPCLKIGVFDTKLPSGSLPMHIFADFAKAAEFCSLLNKAQEEGTLWQPT